MKMRMEIPIVLFFIIISALLGYYIGIWLGMGMIKTQAVENNAAYWQIESNGSTIFQWNEPNEPEN